MIQQIAFISDIHGEVEILDKALRYLKQATIEHCVFLGDYVNKGSKSEETIARLISFQASVSCTFLRGNHDQCMVDALGSEDNVAAFLKIGGAATIRSYLKGKRIGPDVFNSFKSIVPSDHVEFLRSTVPSWENAEVFATHKGPVLPGKLNVLGHFVVNEIKPSEQEIKIDTGCGSKNGRLSVLLLPSRRIIQFSRDARQPVIRDL